MFRRLKTEIWAAALIRRAETGGAFACVARKGDTDAGASLIKVRLLDGRAVLYRSMQDMDGNRIWLPKGPSDEGEIDSMITKRLDRDPDLWVIEIDDRQGRHFLTEPVEE